MFRAIAQHAPFAILVVDGEGEVVYGNDEAAHLLGRTREELAGAKVTTTQQGRVSLAGLDIPESYVSETGCDIVVLPSPGGRPRHCEIRRSPVVNRRGKGYTTLVLDDVTARVDAQRALRNQEKRWNLALRGSLIGVFEFDLVSGRGSASDIWFQLIGIDNSEGLDSEAEWHRRVHPEDMAGVLAADAECFAGRADVSEAKYRMWVGPDGEPKEWRWMRSILRVTERGADGRPTNVLGTMIDITALEEAAALARQKEAELEMLIAHAPVAMAVLAPDGRFLFQNEGCCRALGYSPEALAEMSFWTLGEQQMLAELEREVAGLGGDTGSYHAEKTYQRPDGTAADFSIRISRISDDRPGRTRLIVQMIDITEQRRLARLKDDFVATVSHELRTPLTSLQGALGLMQGLPFDRDPELLRRLLDLASRNGARLLTLVEDLLDFQRLGTAQLPVRLEPVDAVEVVGEALAAGRVLAAKFGVRLEMQAPEAAIMVQADPERLKQVVVNLLSNAAKFSAADDRVTLAVAPEAKGCVISVTDHGRGISAEFSKRIFTPFAQQDEHLSRDREGSGLGLAIAKRMVERMLGEIGYESQPGERTTFWVRLPLLRA